MCYRRTRRKEVRKMTEEQKQEVTFVLSLLKMTLIKNKLAMATSKKGDILIFSSEEYLAKDGKLADCDGIVTNIKDLVGGSNEG